MVDQNESTEPTHNWVHEAFDLKKDKPSVVSWATCSMSADGDTFTKQDNGKFIVLVVNPTKGQYYLCIVFKERMTVHSVRVDSEEGDNSTINNKSFGSFCSVPEMIKLLSNDPLPSKWPVKLIAGRDADTGKIVPSGSFAHDESEDEV
eukprot:m.152152 g.152152  ORF g.152152 m.152152 type:complete len:148 (+) comp30795_c3_seq1:455-898(+)